MSLKSYLFALITFNVLLIDAQSIMNVHLNSGNVLQIPLNTIDSITYTINNPGNLASITTSTVSSITGTSAASGGNITNDGGTLITQRGICYSQTPSPTTANSTIISGSGIGSFTSNLIGLTASTTYYVRAYAINSAGTAYGNEVSFTSASLGGSIVTNPGAGVTFNGYTYSSIVLGNGQEWMSENLRTAFYANGDPIPNVTDDQQWANLNTGAWAYNWNDSQYENPYGRLYNWYTVNDSRNVCPTGWHVPSDIEWSTFINYLDPNADGGNNVNIAGGKMKSTGTQYWTTNIDGTNESGFSGLPAGRRLDVGGFSALGSVGDWWSSTDSSTSNAWFRRIVGDSGNLYRSNTFSKKEGLTIRCVKD
jgi:uncharacterized protein (TIGR02145 family)